MRTTLKKLATIVERGSNAPYNTAAKLEKYGFEREPQFGSYKSVYLHPDGFVLKRARAAFLNEEYEVRKLAQRRGLIDWLPKQRRLSRTVIKQERANPNGKLFAKNRKKLFEVADQLGLNDVHFRNVGFRKDGSPVFIDYGWNNCKAC